MSTTARPAVPAPPPWILPAIAWLALITVAALPEIVAFEMLSQPAVPLFTVKLAILAVLTLIAVIVRSLRAIVPFLIIVGVILAGEWARGELAATPFWDRVTRGSPEVDLLVGQLSRLALTGVLIVTALIVRRRDAGYLYLAPGHIRAPMKAVVWLGFKDDQIRWSRFGWMSALAVGSGTLLFLWLGGGEMMRAAGTQVVRNLPIVLLLATMNAFSEEVTFRSVLLAPLRDVVSPRHAVMMTAVFFGILHFYGVPYGLAGVAMSGFLGWLLGKAMVETNGLFWPWFIHFVQDVLIFSFVLVGLRPGG